MPDIEDQSVTSPASITTNGDEPVEQQAQNLETLASVLTAEQWQTLMASVPEEVLRTAAVNQQHPLGRVVQSESNRQMESWRQNELNRQKAEKAKADVAARQHWLETAPADEVVERIRTENAQAAMQQQIQIQQFQALFNELNPLIASLPEARKARVHEFILRPDADQQWFKLPGLVHSELKAHERDVEQQRSKLEREKQEALSTAKAVQGAPPTDVGKGSAPAGGTTGVDLLRSYGSGESDDTAGAIEALKALGVKGLPSIKRK